HRTPDPHLPRLRGHLPHARPLPARHQRGNAPARGRDLPAVRNRFRGGWLLARPPRFPRDQPGHVARFGRPRRGSTGSMTAAGRVRRKGGVALTPLEVTAIFYVYADSEPRRSGAWTGADPRGDPDDGSRLPRSGDHAQRAGPYGPRSPDGGGGRPGPWRDRNADRR